MSIRPLAYLFLLFGGFAGLDAARDELRGVAIATAPTRSFALETAVKADQPELFRGLMTYQWGRACAGVAAGLLILALARRADRLDPFSPNFAGSKELDELHHDLSEKQEQSRRPFRH